MSKRLSALVLAIIAVGVAHMSEQLVTSIEEYHMIRDALGGWYAMFPANYADHASVTLITIVFTAISLVFYALMRGGRAPLFMAAIFGILGVGEGHHWLQAVSTGGYDPGLITSFLYVGIGVLILKEVARESGMRAPQLERVTA
ncbi:MAG TPA: HXXEE domain-containing protein [Sphingomicrobium sp.]